LNENISIREHMLNFINALVNISPSRNIISQLILLLPKDLMVVRYSYPEVLSEEAKEFLDRCLGIEFNEIVKRRSNSFAESLYTHIHKLFDWLDSDEVRSDLAKLMGTHIMSIPNPYAEWARLVLKKLLERPEGDKILVFIRMLVEHGSFIVNREGYSRGAKRPDWQPFLNEVKRKIKANPAEFEDILRTVIGTSEETIDEGGTPRSSWIIYLKHSEYHLDLILSEHKTTWSGWSHWYDHIYRVRHRSTIKSILKELLGG